MWQSEKKNNLGDIVINDNINKIGIKNTYGEENIIAASDVCLKNIQKNGIRMAFIISLKSLCEDCECGCHFSDETKEYNNLYIEHCFLKRIFNAVKRYSFN